MDDILTGANSEEDTLEYQSQLIKLCSQAQFELRKWASNSSQILHAVPAEARAMSPSVLLNNSEQLELKVHGLKWDPSIDIFSFSNSSSSHNPTKRTVLSDIARVFDSLCLISPITFLTKHIMQQLWTVGIAWDNQIPTDIAVVWNRYQTELKSIENISIPRRITFDQATSLQLHAFFDSSEKGYAAGIYLRVQTSEFVSCHLVIGKSKVAPLKRSTIPRLELCGAVLAAKLLHFVCGTYSDRVQINQLFAWTDSTTVLAWLKSSPHRWATFVANRTSQIQELTSPAIWRHVPTQLNPVDCASRGLYPSEIANHPLWWSGPPFLCDPPEQWPSSPSSTSNGNEVSVTEAKKQTVLIVNVESTVVNILDRFSSLDKNLRIIAYCLRLSKARRKSSSWCSCIIGASEKSCALSALVYSV